MLVDGGMCHQVESFLLWVDKWKQTACALCLFLANQESAESMEELDEDIAVTQSQVNFTCPLTQVDYWLDL